MQDGVGAPGSILQSIAGGAPHDVQVVILKLGPEVHPERCSEVPRVIDIQGDPSIL